MKLTTETFGDFIRDLRNKENMTRKDLGKVLNLNHRTIEHWENGRKPPRGMVEFYNFMKRLENEQRNQRKDIKKP